MATYIALERSWGLCEACRKLCCTSLGYPAAGGKSRHRDSPEFSVAAARIDEDDDVDDDDADADAADDDDDDDDDDDGDNDDDIDDDDDDDDDDDADDDDADDDGADEDDGMRRMIIVADVTRAVLGLSWALEAAVLGVPWGP